MDNHPRIVMNNEEAKFILQAYRAGGQDANDPQFAEALNQAQKDPEVAAWFAQEKSLDTAISQKLKAYPVPPSLKSGILAGRKVVQLRPAWQRPVVWALAASVAFLITFFALWPNLNPASLGSYRKEMAARLTDGHYLLQMTNEDMTKLRQYLATQAGHSDFVLPAGLEGKPGVGCQVLDWNGKKVTLICMRTDQSGFVHLFVINRTDLPNPPPQGAPLFAKAGDWMTAAWTLGDKSYLLTGRTDRDTLASLL